MCGADHDVELHLDIGDARLDAELERTAFRIIQESLSNMAKHAVPTHARVSVTGDTNALEVDVVNAGTVPTRPGDGSGIRGIRERAEHLGGTLVAGPTPTGWHVRARLPVRHDRPAVLS